MLSGEAAVVPEPLVVPDARTFIFSQGLVVRRTPAAMLWPTRSTLPSALPSLVPLDMRIEAHTMVILVGVLYQPVCGIAQAGVADGLNAQDLDTTLVDHVCMRASLPEVRSLPIPTLTDSTRWQEWKAKATKPKTTGTINLGAVYGVLPFTQGTTSNWNGMLRGHVGTEVLGLPLAIGIDLGTDQPIRGQRNRITVQFDAPRAAELARWDGTRALHQARVQADSLTALKDSERRRVHGLTARLYALKEPIVWNDSLVDQNVPTSPVAPEIPSLDCVLVKAPTDQLPLADSLASIRASLTQDLAEATARYYHFDTLEQHYRAVEGRARAVVQATQGGSLKDVLTKGIHRIQLGTCTPTGTEFLLNGITYQGAALELAHRGVYLAVDHGRSLDDRARDTDPVSLSLRQLSQSLFLIDVRDLAPVRLTAVRATYVQVGYLNGVRADVPVGGLAPMDHTTNATNHVLELSGGLKVEKRHGLNFAYARSIVSDGYENAESDATRIGALDLVSNNAPQDEAIMLRWSSDIDRWGTHVEAEARSADQHFQSFGLGFVRIGSRSLGLRLDQRISPKLRIKLRAHVEDRALPSLVSPQQVLIRRGQAMVSYRPNRVLTLNAHATPVVTTGPLSGVPGNVTWAYSSGASLRKRWSKTTATCQADASLFQWRAGEAPGQSAVNTSITFGLEKADRWQATVQWNQFRNTGIDSLPPAHNFSMGIGLVCTEKTRFDAAMQWTGTGQWGYNATIRQGLAKRWTLIASATRYAQYAPIGLDGQAPLGASINTWTTSLEHTW
jgi:hypothetical protein